MRVIKVQENLYKKAEKASIIQGIEVNDLIAKAINQGLEVLSEKNVLGLYREHKISLQRAAELLSIDIWDMIEKLKMADIHIDYSMEELAEDLR